MSFINAMTSDVPVADTGAAVLDMFYKLGAMRGSSDREIQEVFVNALREDPLTAMKILFYNRDIRGGQGERKSFRVIMTYLATANLELARKNIRLIPEYGRWDDLFVFVGTELEGDAFGLIRGALLEGNGLCAKWMPREKSAKRELAVKLRTFLGMTSKEYRKTLSRLTNVVETQMCDNQWNEIEYSHVPSVAMKNYRKAFGRRSADRFGAYLTALESGDKSVKINAAAVFPHDIVLGWVSSGSYYSRGRTAPDAMTIRAAEAQWKALPDYMGENSGKVLAMADVSGSMTGRYGMGSGTLTPMDASVSLALYTAERAKGPFKDFFMTFSGSPAFVKVEGNNIYEKIMNISRANWAQNTNLQAGIEAILARAIQHNVPQEDMPETLLIISDMQFNTACRRDANYSELRRKYREAGYVLPSVVFWNVANHNDASIKRNANGVGLVSGFSPSVLTAILGGEMSPMAILDRAINSGRYDSVTI